MSNPPRLRERRSVNPRARAARSSIAKTSWIRWLAFLLWLAPGFAAGKQSSGPCDKKKECSELLRAGVSAYKDQDFPVALQAFQSAYDIAPDPVLLLNLGRTYFRLDQPDK